MAPVLKQPFQVIVNFVFSHLHGHHPPLSWTLLAEPVHCHSCAASLLSSVTFGVCHRHTCAASTIVTAMNSACESFTVSLFLVPCKNGAANLGGPNTLCLGTTETGCLLHGTCSPTLSGGNHVSFRIVQCAHACAYSHTYMCATLSLPLPVLSLHSPQHIQTLTSQLYTQQD